MNWAMNWATQPIEPGPTRQVRSFGVLPRQRRYHRSERTHRQEAGLANLEPVDCRAGCSATPGRRATFSRAMRGCPADGCPAWPSSHASAGDGEAGRPEGAVKTWSTLLDADSRNYGRERSEADAGPPPSCGQSPRGGSVGSRLTCTECAVLANANVSRDSADSISTRSSSRDRTRAVTSAVRTHACACCSSVACDWRAQ